MSTPDVPSDNDGAYILATRGGIVENRHLIHAAVVDCTGRLLYSVGDPQRVTLLRSAAKPAQAAAILDAATSYTFDDEEVALMCASHNSEGRHLEIARRMLAKTHTSENDLQCGGHPSIHPALNAAWIRADFVPTAIHNNCSGKHIGMVAGAKALGESIEGYQRLGRPMQQRVKRTFEELCSLRPNEVSWGVDGCNLPAPAVPLRAMGLMYGRLAEAAGATVVADAESKTPPMSRTRILARIFHCMTSYPHLVAGTDRFCTTLMEAFQGSVVGKVGADGCYGVAIRPLEDTTRLSGISGTALGVAVKVEDGNLDILHAAVAEILDQLQIGTLAMRRKLDPFHQVERRNTMDVVIGRVEFPFRLRKVENEKQAVATAVPTAKL